MAISNCKNGNITWKQVGVLISIIGMFAIFFGWTTTKADKTELEKAEIRVEKKVDSMYGMLKEDIDEIKEKQNKIYDILVNKKKGESP